MVNFCEFAETFPIFSGWALSRAGLRDLYVYINSQLSVFRIWILKVFSLTQRCPRQLWANEKWKNSWKKKSCGQLMPVCITLVQLWLRKSLSQTYAPMEWKWRRRGDFIQICAHWRLARRKGNVAHAQLWKIQVLYNSAFMHVIVHTSRQFVNFGVQVLCIEVPKVFWTWHL